MSASAAAASKSATRTTRKPSLPAASDLSDAALGFAPRATPSSSRPADCAASPSAFVLPTRDIHFLDAHGRALLLHGVNVSGSSKLPASSSSSSEGGGGDTITFVNRPFPLSDAPAHLARLRAWGLTTLRLLVTWEALQPSTPHSTDASFLSYLHALISLLPQYGMRAFVCAHQDVWSRACGGSGAPGWTLELVGLEVGAFHGTGAAYVHERVLAEQAEAEEGGSKKADRREKVGPFVWPSGYQKLAAATMATVFWAGDTFAYKVRVPRSWAPGQALDDPAANGAKDEEMVGLQTFLQDAYLKAFGELADAVGGLEAVLGFDVMNEPHRGFINLHSFDEWDYDTDLHIGFFPSFLQSVALGEGHAQLVPFYVKSFPFPTTLSHYSLLEPPPPSPTNPPLWRQNGPTRGQCLWRMHDVWAWDEGRVQPEFALWERLAHWGANLRGHGSVRQAIRGKPVSLRSDYFEYDPRVGVETTGKGGMKAKRRRVEWYRDCYAPFVSRFAERIRASHPHLHIFYEPIPNEFIPPWRGASALQTAVPTMQAKTLEERNRDADELEELEHAARAQRYSHASSRVLIDTPRPAGSIFAPHFYDLHVLFNKASGAMSVNVQGLSRGMFVAKALYFGARGAYRNYKTQISNLIAHGHLSLGRGPTLIGEIGIPYDINSHHAFKTGDYRVQSRLLDALIGAMEASWASFTLWNYCAENTVEQGDMWNAEDFSLMTLTESAQDRSNVRGLRGEPLYQYGRCLDAIIRPYAVKIAGVPLSTSFDRDCLAFDLVWATSSSWPLTPSASSTGSGEEVVDRSRLTEVFWPRFHYEGREVEVELSDGEWWMDEEKQSLYVLHADVRPGCKHSLSVRVKGMPLPAHKRRSVGAIDVLLVGTVLGAIAVLLFGVDRLVRQGPL
ncbi:hypothetical protein OC842_002757 [Tilletia horrida]|uniref:Glycoside hydrolase family 5 C-terminal domain-containing protein n=1 Tax=Tilletia horrida TaxID=155126 RepID=A0AAN6JL17_9BASI|nr:hypothetical protein OC842_002757 [Tilletia horrida]